MKSLLISFALLKSSLLFAQEADEEITVYASRTQDALSETPASVTIIDRKKLDKFDVPGQNLGTALGKMLPGFGAPTESVSNFGQTLRGRDVLILIDGIPQMENRQVSRQLNNIKTESIERIEVISGANAIYGAGAPGGIINIITKGYREELAGFETYLGTSFASNPISHLSQTYNVQQSVSGTLGVLQYLASVGGEWRNNRFDSSGNVIAPEPAQTSRSDTDTFDALVKLKYHFSNSSSAELSYEHFSEKQDTDYVVQLNPYRAETGLDLEEQPSSRRDQLALHYVQKDFFGHNLSVLGYFRQRDLTFFPFALTVPVPIVNQSRTFAEVSGVKATIQKPITPAIDMTWGLDLEMDKGKQRAHSYDQLRYEISGAKTYSGKSADYDYGPVIDTEKAALFAQFKAKITEGLKSKFGLRYEQISQKVHDFTPPLETAISKNWPILYAGVAQMEAAGRVAPGTTASLPRQYRFDNFQGGTLDYDAWATNLGLTYDLTPKNLVFINYSQGYELGDTARLMRDAVATNSLIPTISPIFGLAINATTVDGLDLQTIKTSSYEVGWRGSLDRIFGNAALYYNESDKVYQFNSDFTVDLLDLKKRVYGLEAEVGVRPTDDLTLGVSHSRAKGEARRAEGSGWAAVSGMEVSPPKTAAYVDYLYNADLRFNLQAQHLASYNKEDDINPNDRKTALDLHEYFLMDSSLDYAFNEASSLKFAVNNLLNRRYKTLFHQWAEFTYGEASGAPAEGRRFSLVYRHVY
ncbi:MAG: TonB-dependent receptor [Proteobacteria bacterium]|nr:MAG: TonB-dependent receptor [Pseudomonadota bacterium]